MEKEILIEGMSCSESVKKALSKVSGVKEVNVDLDKKITENDLWLILCVTREIGVELPHSCTSHTVKYENNLL